MTNRIVSSIVAALGIVGGAFAQTAAPAGASPAAPAKVTRQERQAMLEDILTKLNLTQAQKDKLKTHAEEMKTKYAGLRKALRAATPAERQEKMKAVREEQMAFLKATLTKPQLETYKRLRAEDMKKLKSGGTINP